MNPRLLFAAGLALVLAGSTTTSVCKASAPRAQDEKKAPAQDEKKAPAIDPSGVLKQIQAELQSGKVDEAITKLEKMAKDKPKDRATLAVLALVTQQKAQQMMEDRKASIPVFLKSADAAKKLLAASKDEGLPANMVNLVGTALYNGACSLALDSKGDEAMAMLKESIDAGFSEFGTLKADKELDSIRDRPDFAALIKSLDAKAGEAEAKEAAKAVAEVPSLFKENKAFPFSFELPGLDDKKVSLGDYKGKVVIVDFWGTWCPPCRKEIPHFVDLLKENKDKGLEIVGINYEDGAPDEVKKVIKEYLEENKVPYTCVIGDEKTQQQVPDFEGYPTTLFLDRTGKVRLKVVGYHTKPVLEAIVKTLLDEKAE